MSSPWLIPVWSVLGLVIVVQIPWRVKSHHSKSAKQRAQSLLHEHMTETQRWEYERKEWFEVHGSDGRRYRIIKKYSANVHSGRMQYCLVPRGYGRHVPLDDHLLGEMLLLRANALEFRAKACAHRPL